MEDQIVSVAVPRPLDHVFTYKISDEMARDVQVGGWVKVPFGRSKTHAYVVEAPQSLQKLPEGLSPEKLKHVVEVGRNEGVIPEDVIRLISWAHEYYQSPLGEIYQCAAPASALGLRSKKQEARPLKPSEALLAGPQIVELTEEQREAVAQLEELRTSDSLEKPLSRTALLNGVTGSGKTEVYLDLARRVIAENKSVLILVPEIALTPQLHHRFEKGLGVPVGLWHSAVADGLRRDQWAALRSGDLRVIVGARSSVFAPLKDLGLVIVDEEHDPTYKQEDRFRYQARDLALVRASFCGALTILGSATPSLESLENVKRGRFKEIHLKNRFGQGGMPSVEIVNLCEEESVEGIQAHLADKTLKAIQETIDQGDQVMIFLNRRGFSAFLVCEECGEVHGCPDCSISLSFHKYRNKLQCHICGYEEAAPTICRECDGDSIIPVGAGTESLEEELPELLEGIKALRLDRDKVTSATRLTQILDDFREGKANTLLGTQMLVKGHDFPRVTLVVVILADGLFRWPDYRAPERAYQILTQVSGRAGRGDKPGKVMIQTYAPEHAVIKLMAGATSVEDFLAEERELREALCYPPFGRLARLRFENSDRDLAMKASKQLFDALQTLGTSEELMIMGPSEAFLEKMKGQYRVDLLLKAKSIQDLSKAVKSARQYCRDRQLSLLIDVDPSGIS